MHQRTDPSNAGSNGSARRRRPSTPTIVRLASHDADFLIVDKTAARDPKLSFRAVGLHTYLLGLPDNWQVMVDDLAKRHRDGRDSVRAGLDELRDAGYAALRCVRDRRGKVVAWEWVIYETPALAHPDTEFPLLDRPQAGKAVLDSNATRPETACPEVAEPEVAEPEVANPPLLRTECSEDPGTDSGSAALRRSADVLSHVSGGVRPEKWERFKIEPDEHHRIGHMVPGVPEKPGVFRLFHPRLGHVVYVGADECLRSGAEESLSLRAGQILWRSARGYIRRVAPVIEVLIAGGDELRAAYAAERDKRPPYNVLEETGDETDGGRAPGLELARALASAPQSQHDLNRFFPDWRWLSFDPALKGPPVPAQFDFPGICCLYGTDGRLGFIESNQRLSRVLVQYVKRSAGDGLVFAWGKLHYPMDARALVLRVEDSTERGDIDDMAMLAKPLWNEARRALIAANNARR